MSTSSALRIMTHAAVISFVTTAPARAEDKGVQATLDASPEAVHKAAADALAVIGCEIGRPGCAHLRSSSRYSWR